MESQRQQTAIGMIVEERARQIEQEGYTAEHDDTEHPEGELADMAACYAVGAPVIIPVGDPEDGDCVDAWEPEVWGPFADAIAGKDRIRQLVIAGALVVAEIERLQRANAAKEGRPCSD